MLPGNSVLTLRVYAVSPQSLKVPSIPLTSDRHQSGAHSPQTSCTHVQLATHGVAPTSPARFCNSLELTEFRNTVLYILLYMIQVENSQTKTQPGQGLERFQMGLLCHLPMESELSTSLLQFDYKISSECSCIECLVPRWWCYMENHGNFRVWAIAGGSGHREHACEANT